MAVMRVASRPSARAAIARRSTRCCSSAAEQASPFWVANLQGRGRGVLSSGELPEGTPLLTCRPLAQVVKVGGGQGSCSYCLGEVRPPATYCSAACEVAHEAVGSRLLARCDLDELRKLHTEEGRKFPLFIAQLLAALLEGLRHDATRAPAAWGEAMALCFAELPTEVKEHIEVERQALLRAFVDANVSTPESLELLMPAPTYSRLLGAAQLNAFELTSTRGLVVSALLGAPASFFNHSCQPNVVVAAAADHQVTFMTRRPVLANEELTISYVEQQTLEDAERRDLLESKYGFRCVCPICRALPA